MSSNSSVPPSAKTKTQLPTAPQSPPTNIMGIGRTGGHTQPANPFQRAASSITKSDAKHKELADAYQIRFKELDFLLLLVTRNKSIEVTPPRTEDRGNLGGENRRSPQPFSHLHIINEHYCQSVVVPKEEVLSKLRGIRDWCRDFTEKQKITSLISTIGKFCPEKIEIQGFGSASLTEISGYIDVLDTSMETVAKLTVKWNLDESIDVYEDCIGMILGRMEFLRELERIITQMGGEMPKIDVDGRLVKWDAVYRNFRINMLGSITEGMENGEEMWNINVEFPEPGVDDNEVRAEIGNAFGMARKTHTLLNLCWRDALEELGSLLDGAVIDGAKEE